MADDFAWLRCTGEMADRIRAHDWAGTPLGPPATWPQSFRSALTFCLTSAHPAYVWWGPELINLYNDAYIALAGSRKHPDCLGKPAREMWPEIWDSILVPFVNEVVNTGHAVWREDMRMPLERAGIVEEAYFSFSFGPALDERGNVAGIICTCVETTPSVASEKLFRDIVDTSPVILWITDGDGRCTYLSKQWFELTGRTPELDLGIGWLENVHPDDRAHSAEMFLRANETRTPFHFDYRIRRRDGSYRWALDAGFPRFDADGRFRGFIGSVVDIDERVRLEARFRNVSESIGLGVWYCDLPFSEFIWDRTVKEHFFLAPDARVTIATFYERLHPDDRERVRLAIENSIAKGAPYDIHYRTTHPDDPNVVKHIRAIGWTAYDQNGRPVRFDGVTLDVTEETRAERLLHDSQQRFELATRATKNAIWDWDLTTNTIEWNEAVHTEYGHPRETVHSNIAWWTANVHPDDVDRVSATLDAAIASESDVHWSDEYRFRKADGTYALVLDRGFILRDSHGKPVRMIGAMEDITARKQAEEGLRAAIRVRDEFLSIASHELKTPLTSLKLQAQLATRSLRSGDASSASKAWRLVAQTERQVDRLSGLVDDMLDVSRLASGKLSLDKEPTDLASLVRDVVEQFQPQFEAIGANIELRTNGAIEAVVDRARVEQVLVNLLSNALKYGERKPVQVSLAKHDGLACIAVRDQGIGISAENQARVFDRFERAVPASGVSGLGLGLYITRNIVEMHGGRIEVVSELGKGSTFEVELPAE